MLSEYQERKDLRITRILPILKSFLSWFKTNIKTSKDQLSLPFLPFQAKTTQKKKRPIDAQL